MNSYSITLLITLLLIIFTACSKNEWSKKDIFTLYSTNYPNDSGRSPVATFEFGVVVDNQMLCLEAADLYKTDFEVRKKAKGWNAEMRLWCEKGRFEGQ